MSFAIARAHVAENPDARTARPTIEPHRDVACTVRARHRHAASPEQTHRAGATMPAGPIARQSVKSFKAPGAGAGRSAGALGTARGVATAAVLVALLSTTAQAACKAYGKFCHTVNDLCDEGHYCSRNWGTNGQCQRTFQSGDPCDLDRPCEQGLDCRPCEELPSSPCYAHAHTGRRRKRPRA